MDEAGADAGAGGSSMPAPQAYSASPLQWALTIAVAVLLFIAQNFLKSEPASERRERIRAARKKKERDEMGNVDELLSKLVTREEAVQKQAAAAAAVAGTSGLKPGTTAGPGPPGVGQTTKASAVSPANEGKVGESNDAASSEPKKNPLRWTQNNGEVEIFLHMPPDVTKADVRCNFSPLKLMLFLKGKPVLAGDFWEPVDPDGCNWQLDVNQSEIILWIQLEKARPCKDVRGYWKSLLKVDPQKAAAAAAAQKSTTTTTTTTTTTASIIDQTD